MVIVSSPICTAERAFLPGRPMPAAQRSRGCMIRRLLRALLLALLAVITMQDHWSGARAYERPYFMPRVEQDRLHSLISNGEFFKGGQVGIPEVYYDTDISGYLAFDWAHKGLEGELGFQADLDRGPLGLATDNRELIEWGFRRTKPWGARLGSYDVVLDTAPGTRRRSIRSRTRDC